MASLHHYYTEYFMLFFQDMLRDLRGPLYLLVYSIFTTHS